MRATVTVTPKGEPAVYPARTVILTLGTGTAFGPAPNPANKTATVNIQTTLPIPAVAITSCPASVTHSTKVTVTWTITNPTAMKLNRVEWGTAGPQGPFPNVTASTLTSLASYQATFTAPATKNSKVYVRVHMTTSGGLDCCSADVKTVNVQ